MATRAKAVPYAVEVEFEPDGDQSVDNEVPNEDSAQVLSKHVGNATGSITGTFISVQSIRNARVHVVLNISQHGVLWPSADSPTPASIVAFRIICDTKDTRTRFQSLVLDLELESMNSPSKPTIHKYSPVHVVGESTQTKRELEVHSGLVIGGGFTPVSVELGLSQGFSSRHLSRFELKAITSGTSCISWLLKENEGSMDGVPTDNDFALLIGSQGNFTIRLSIKARLSPSLHPTSWIGMRSCRTATIPILLKKQVGPEIPKNLLDDMDKIELSDYVILEDC